MDGASCDEARMVVLSEGSKVVMVEVYVDRISYISSIYVVARQYATWCAFRCWATIVFEAVAV